MTNNLSLLEYWKLVWPVVDHVTVGEEYNRAVGGEENEDVPDTVEVREAHASPVGTEEPVIDPGHQRHRDDPDAPFAEVDDPRVPLGLEHHHHEANAGDRQ